MITFTPEQEEFRKSVARFVDADHPAPVGDMWKTARVMLPAPLAECSWRDVFTGVEVKPVRANGSGAWLFVGQVLKHLPVALLASV